MSLKQEADKSIIKFLHQLRETSRYCEYEALRIKTKYLEEELIQLKLIDGMDNTSHNYRMLEQLQECKMSVNSCVYFIQQELIKNELCWKSRGNYWYIHDKKKKLKLKYKYCNYKNEPKRKLCKISKKRNHFQTVHKFKKECIDM